MRRDKGSAAANTLAVLLAIVLIAAVIVGGYQLGWWLKKDAVNRNAKINQDTYGRQNALVEQILDDIKDAETAGIPPQQRVAIIGQICDSANKLTGSIQLTGNAANFVAREC